MAIFDHFRGISGSFDTHSFEAKESPKSIYINKQSKVVLIEQRKKFLNSQPTLRISNKLKRNEKRDTGRADRMIDRPATLRSATSLSILFSLLSLVSQRDHSAFCPLAPGGLCVALLCCLLCAICCPLQVLLLRPSLVSYCNNHQSLHCTLYYLQTNAQL